MKVGHVGVLVNMCLKSFTLLTYMTLHLLLHRFCQVFRRLLHCVNN